MKKKHLYKVYSKSTSAVKQLVFDGNFEGISDTVYNDYWDVVGTPTHGVKNRVDAYPDTTTESAIELDGTANYIAAPSVSADVSPAINYTDFTFFVRWYKADWDEGTDQSLVDHISVGDAGKVRGWGLFIDNTSSKLQARVALGSGTGGVTEASIDKAEYDLSSISAGWHTIGFGSDGRYIRLWVDGVEVDTYDNTTDIGISDINDHGIYIGKTLRSSESTDYATGVVSSMGFYSALLTTSQVLAIHDSNNPIFSDLEFHYSMNEATGSSLSDDIASADATIFGGVTWTTGFGILERSVYIKSSTTGSADQGIEQAAANTCYITGGNTYIAHAWVKGPVGKFIEITVTPTGGGSADNANLVGNGEWQRIAVSHTAHADATRLSVKILLVDADDDVYDFYIDKVAVNEGTTMVDYFDGDTEGSDNSLYSYNTTDNLHQITSVLRTYVATWGNEVVSDFGFSQEINSAGGQTRITLARSYPDYGEGTDVDFDLEVQVYAIDDNYINGVNIFTGYISDYIVDEAAEKIDIVVFGYGAHLNEYVLKGETRLAIMPITGTTKQFTGAWSDTVWSFGIHLTAASEIRKIKMHMGVSSAGDVPIQFSLYRGDPTLNDITVTAGTPAYNIDSGNELIEQATASVTVSSETGTVYTWEFSNTTHPAGDYYIDAGLIDSSAILEVYGSGSDSVSATESYKPVGRAYGTRATANNSTFGVSLQSDLPMAYMEILKPQGESTDVSFDSVDPSAIVRYAVQNLISQGGDLTYDENSIPLSGTTVSYDFKSATILQVVNKALELSPKDWYFYIDQGTSKLVFKPKNTGIQHKLVIGNHVNQLNLDKRSRDIVNTVLFIGGVTNGSNLYRKYTNASSIATYGERLKVITDNRVTLESTASIMANRVLDKQPGPEIMTRVKVVNYNLESISVGDVFSFRGAESTPGELSLFDVGKFDVARFDYSAAVLDTLRLQAARVDYRSGHSAIVLSSTPPDVNKRVQDIRNNLDNINTIENPSQPN